jgi:two-component sensor histidine kinase/CheY-like chemotaxis protein
MIFQSETPDLLVIDKDDARHAGYASLLSDLVECVVTASPGAMHEAADGRARAGVILNLDGLEASTEGTRLIGIAAALAGAGPGTPIVLVASDPEPYRALIAQGAGVFDFLPAPVVPELLRSKVAMLAEQARMRSRLAHGEGKLGQLAGQVSEEVHRTKNLLAMVQSIALRTLVDGREIGAARQVLVGRLRALSRAYQIVAAAAGKGTDLTDLVEAELGDATPRVRVSGPPMRLSGSVVHTLALAIHELSDNAQRYGALRFPDGLAAVGWTYFERGAERYLEIVWTESGGAPVAAPAHYGFGLSLVSSLAGSTPSPSVQFDDGGFSCRMRLAHDALVLV